MKLILLLMFLINIPLAVLRAQDLSEEEEIVMDAIQILKDFKNLPEQNIPPKVISSAYGLAIVPGYVKVGFVAGGSFGRGVMLVRQGTGWSYPVFIAVGGGSLGWQIGVQSIDLILVFRTRKSLEGFLKGRFTLGLDVSVAAGPVGRSASAGTDPALDAEVYSYSRAKGLYAGISLAGTIIKIDTEANKNYYDGEYTVEDIRSGRLITIPKSAFELRDILNTF